MLFKPEEQTPTGPPKFLLHPLPATSSAPCHLSHTYLPLFLLVHIPAEPHKLVYRPIGVLVGNLMLSLRFGQGGRDEGVCAVDLGCNLNACWIWGRGLGPSSHLLAAGFAQMGVQVEVQATKKETLGRNLLSHGARHLRMDTDGKSRSLL